MFNIKNQNLIFEISIALIKTRSLIDNKNKTELIDEFFVLANKISFFKLKNPINFIFKNNKIV